jgi:hypothetical protein
MTASTYTPSGMSCLLTGTSTNLMAGAHIGGIVAVTAALVGSLVLTSSSGAVLANIPPAVVGVFPVLSSGGADGTSATFSSASDAGKCYVALLLPNSTL